MEKVVQELVKQGHGKTLFWVWPNAQTARGTQHMKKTTKYLRMEDNGQIEITMRGLETNLCQGILGKINLEYKVSVDR